MHLLSSTTATYIAILTTLSILSFSTANPINAPSQASTFSTSTNSNLIPTNPTQIIADLVDGDSIIVPRQVYPSGATTPIPIPIPIPTKATQPMAPTGAGAGAGGDGGIIVEREVIPSILPAGGPTSIPGAANAKVIFPPTQIPRVGPREEPVPSPAPAAVKPTVVVAGSVPSGGPPTGVAGVATGRGGA